MSLQTLENEIKLLQDKLENQKLIIKQKHEIEQNFIEQNKQNLKDKIKLNVGGYKYETCRSTISQYTESMLESLISGRFKIEYDSNDYIFIDRDGEIFKIILNSMRYNKLIIPFDFHDFDLLANEINYYQLPFQTPMSQVGIADFTRREIATILNKDNQFHFEGFRLCGIDLCSHWSPNL